VGYVMIWFMKQRRPLEDDDGCYELVCRNKLLVLDELDGR
jgi:hypothetical protein